MRFCIQTAIANQRFTRLALLSACLAVWCSGCATVGTVRHRSSPADVLLQADRDFALYAQQHGVATAFREFAAPDALSLPMGEVPVRGREAIFRAMSDFPPGELRWRPVGADLARSGDLGYTWGTYEFRAPDAGGKPAPRHGKYVTVWKRQRDGSWKYVVDIGNASPTPN
jgi:ketosteroid isomerase-like protein